MIASIGIGGGLHGALAYNQQKVDEGKGKVLETNRIFVPTDGRFSVVECVRDFELSMPPQVTTTRGTVHISLNPHPDDRLTDDQLTDIGRECIERMGFGGQPWMIFKHEDIDRQHIHIVTTRVRGDGTLISDKNNFAKSKKITDDLEREYGLHPKGERRGEAWTLKPVDAAAGDLKRQVSNVIKPLTEMYRFRSISEYRALLSLYNVGVEKIEGENKGHRYTGLVYSALDADGNRVGQPLKSSLFGKKYGVEGLERLMEKSQMAVKADGTTAKMKGSVSAALESSTGGDEFRAALRGKGIDLVLRHNDGGRLYGVTFIDHNSRTVLNGSALGKEFSANTLAARFPDISTWHRENSAQSVSSHNIDAQPTPEVPRSNGNTSTSPDNHLALEQSQPSNPRPATPTGGPDLSTITNAVGSLFSILTPEPGGSSGGASAPKRKKKCRQFGRQA